LKLLLDSHILLWWSAGDPRLSARAEKLLTATDNEIFVSAASWWELAIKQVLGRLRLDMADTRRLLEQKGVQPISVTPDHALAAAALPALHGDPFDHMLVAQAVTERCTLLTHDKQLKRYGPPVLFV
jgi:PIN domain nuclease of toxin-antitoxin system